MKKTFLIIGAVVATAAVIAVGFIGFFWFFSSRQSIALLPAAPEHGTSFLLESDGASTNAALKAALQVRFAHLGSRIFVETISPTRIRVVTPIVSAGQNQSVLEHIMGGQLEFRLVHPDGQNLIETALLPPGYEVLKQSEAAFDGTTHVLPFLVKKKPELTGKYIQNAMVAHDQIGQPEIEFTLSPEGAGIFTKVTGDNIGQQLAIVVDGKLLSAPRIQSEIGANGVITGHFTEGEATALAAALTHPLPVPVKLIEMKKF